MKWRIAKKIRAAVGTPRQSAYTEGQITQALDRYDRLRSSKLDKECWHALMEMAGPGGRALMVSRWSPADALRILMETPEEQWKGDGGKAWQRFKELQRQE